MLWELMLQPNCAIDIQHNSESLAKRVKHGHTHTVHYDYLSGNERAEIKADGSSRKHAVAQAALAYLEALTPEQLAEVRKGLK